MGLAYICCSAGDDDDCDMDWIENVRELKKENVSVEKKIVWYIFKKSIVFAVLFALLFSEFT